MRNSLTHLTLMSLYNWYYFYSNEPEWLSIKNVLTNNSQAAWINKKPITFFHGNADIHVPYLITEKLIENFRTLGVSDDMAKFVTLEDHDHITGVFPMYVSVIKELLE